MIPLWFLTSKRSPFGGGVEEVGVPIAGGLLGAPEGVGGVDDAKCGVGSGEALPNLSSDA